MNAVKKIGVFLAIGFGTGLSPVASGTVGTLLGIPLVLVISAFLDSGYGFSLPVIVCCALLVVLAIPICQLAEDHFLKKDDGRIVADEYLIFPICMIGLPLDPVWFLIAFLTFRFFDIVKVQPANLMQNFKGGAGIVLDDVVAALYSLGANHLLLLAWSTWA